MDYNTVASYNINKPLTQKDFEKMINKLYGIDKARKRNSLTGRFEKGYTNKSQPTANWLVVSEGMKKMISDAMEKQYTWDIGGKEIETK